MSESRGESRYKNFAETREDFFRRVRFKTGSINNDIGDNRRSIIEELRKELNVIDGDER